jgi:hypothetical protein
MLYPLQGVASVEPLRLAEIPRERAVAYSRSLVARRLGEQRPHAIADRAHLRSRGVVPGPWEASVNSRNSPLTR